MKLDVNYWMNFYAMERSGKPWPAALQPAVCARAQLASGPGRGHALLHWVVRVRAAADRIRMGPCALEYYMTRYMHVPAHAGAGDARSPPLACVNTAIEASSLNDRACCRCQRRPSCLLVSSY